jgi:hypothetical protein
MKVRVSEEGLERYIEYVLPKNAPQQAAMAEAARKYCLDREIGGSCAKSIAIEPADDEARALPGWLSDEDGLFILVRMRPILDWVVA